MQRKFSAGVISISPLTTHLNESDGHIYHRFFSFKFHIVVQLDICICKLHSNAMWCLHPYALLWPNSSDSCQRVNHSVLILHTLKPFHSLRYFSLHARLFYRILYLPLTFARMEVISIKLPNWSGGSAFSTATPFSLNSLLHPMSTPHPGQECLSHLVMSSFSDYIFLSVLISYFISLLSFWTLSDLGFCLQSTILVL